MRRLARIALFVLMTGSGSAQSPPAPLAPGTTLERAVAAEEIQRFQQLG